MDTKLIIDSIMRQTTVLIAQICVSAGIRAPLAHLADEVFLSLSGELESQGVSRKVVADMFGMGLRSYQRRVQRLRESATDGGKTLWQAVLEHLQNEGRATRMSMLERFSRDPPEALGSVLSDLVSSGLASKTGLGGDTLYSVTPEEERRSLAREGQLETATALVWLDICRHPGTTEADLQGRLSLESEVVAQALARLKDDGRLTSEARGDLRASSLDIPVGSTMGWEIAVFDHFQALCAAVATKLRQGQVRSEHSDVTGGATFSYEISSEHPLADRVLGQLAKLRSDASELWEELEAYNAEHPPSEDASKRVVFYLGQFVESNEDDS